jgi:hypothetical protein
VGLSSHRKQRLRELNERLVGMTRVLRIATRHTVEISPATALSGQNLRMTK